MKPVVLSLLLFVHLLSSNPVGLAATIKAMANTLRHRLLHDIAEIKQDAYPNVHLHFDDANIQRACLILTP